MRTSGRPKVEVVEKAIRAVPGGRQEDLARGMGVGQQTVSKLLYGEIPISAEYAIAIHRATNGVVPASELRPDLWIRPEHVPLAPAVEEAVS